MILQGEVHRVRPSVLRLPKRGEFGPACGCNFLEDEDVSKDIWNLVGGFNPSEKY